MAKPPPSAYKRWVLVLISISAVACTVIAGSMLMKGGGLSLPFFTSQADASRPDVRVEYRTEYLRCGDALVEYREHPAAELDSVMAGLSQAWSVAEGSGPGVRLLRQIDDYCDTHLRCRLIAIYRGYVCVFRGKDPDPRFLVRELPDIRETDLAERDRAFLRKGYVIEADPQMPQTEVPAALDREVVVYLEGIKEH
ncbi:MAG: hypothetical protein ACOX5Q_02165 [Bacillota bacterium]|nr:hypothetical protein [Candidatus Fermentithermobacillaceae bacterium]